MSLRVSHSDRSDRRHDIDSLRVGALGFLIVFHTLLVFTSSPWRVKSGHAGRWADQVVAILAPWRMSLVFLVAGIAARFLLDKRTWSQFIRNRALRLLIPFVFALAVIVPPQAYFASSNAGQLHQGYLEFWISRGWFSTDYHGVMLPDFAHAWFLPYLFCYSVVAGALLKFAPSIFDIALDWVETVSIWTVIVGTMALFALVDGIVVPGCPPTGLLVNDISGHLRFAPIFLLGAIIGKSDVFWRRLSQSRGRISLAALALLVVSIAAQRYSYRVPPLITTNGTLAVQGLYGGVMIFAVLAFGTWALSRPSRALTYATDAILPIYLMHQTVIVLAAHVIAPLGWPAGIELAVLLAAAGVGPLLVYHLIVREITLLRLLFGLRPLPRATWGDNSSRTHSLSNRGS
jgi:hypothetical protein